MIQIEQIETRLQAMPKANRERYRTAMGGDNLRAAIFAFCEMCQGWGGPETVESCTDKACPLYPYRPRDD